jgi:hypothetical protein
LNYHALVAKILSFNGDLPMPAKSEKQRKAAGAALAARRSGKTKGLKGPSKAMAKMSESKLRHFAKKRKSKRNY